MERSDNELLALSQRMEMLPSNFRHRQEMLQQQGQLMIGTSIAYYHYQSNDCTVRQVFFNYVECTPKKTEISLKYDGSPMEIEYIDSMSVRDSNTSDVLTTDPTNEQTEVVLKNRQKKTGNILLNSSDKEIKFDVKRKRVGLHKCYFIIASAFLLVLLYLAFSVQVISENCDCDISVDLLSKDLKEEVYNQQECIEMITSSLRNQSLWPKKLKVLVLMGTMGVGKTFITNIVKNHFSKEAIHEIVDLKQAPKSFHPKLCCNLVIIDNLIETQVNEVTKYLGALDDSKYTLALTVFNIQKTDRNLNYYFDEEAVWKTLRDFTASGLHFESCIFNFITESDIHAWLTKEFAKGNIKETSKKNITEYILANSNFTRDGFKRLAQKMSVIAEMFPN